MTRLLAIETSGEACSVAVQLGGECIERFEHAPLRHAERLLPFVRSLLAEAEQPLGGLDAIAFGRGPGSFTSLRIGIGVVQGLAWGAELPVVPVSSLAAAAQEAANDTGRFSGRIRVALDARMQEVYSADFRVDAGQTVRLEGRERVVPPGELLAGVEGPFIAVGNGFERFPELAECAEGAVHRYEAIWPRAAVVAQLALDYLRGHPPLPAMQAQPVYLRDRVAEKPKAG